jgi:hypothetical protein
MRGCKRCGRPIRASHDGDPAVCQASIQDEPDAMARAVSRCLRVVEHRLARVKGYGRIVDIIESIVVSPAFPLAPLLTVRCPTKHVLDLEAQIVHRGEIHQIMRSISDRDDEICLVAIATELLHEVVLSRLDAATSRVRPS